MFFWLFGSFFEQSAAVRQAKIDVVLVTLIAGRANFHGSSENSMSNFSSFAPLRLCGRHFLYRRCETQNLCGSRLATFLPDQKFLYKIIDIAVEYRVDIRDFVFCSRIFYPTVWVK